jgi:hypothetical protein
MSDEVMKADIAAVAAEMKATCATGSCPSPTPELLARVCPECGAQSTRDRLWREDMRTYCLNHEDEPGRIERPQHVTIEVVPLSKFAELRDAAERHRAEATHGAANMKWADAQLHEALERTR